MYRYMATLGFISLLVTESISANSLLGLIPGANNSNDLDRQSTDLSPAISTVITRDEIEAFGYRNIRDALSTVPGIHVGVEDISVRGFTTARRAHILVLLNGQSRVRNVYGDFADEFGYIPIEAIDRIEIIRGPSSAAYGSDSFSATINIVTKDEDTGKLVTASFGESISEVYGMSARTVGTGTLKTEIAISDDKGYDEWVEKDLQSLIDPMLPSPISNAPGRAFNGKKQGTVSANWHSHDAEISARISGTRNGALGIGVLPVLDKTGRYTKDIVDLYASKLVVESEKTQMTLRTRIAYTRLGLDDLTLWPKGAFGVFPEGVKAWGELDERYVEAGLNYVFTGFNKHQLTGDVSYKYQKIDTGEYKTNYSVDPQVGYIPSENPVDHTGSERRKYTTLRMQDVYALNGVWSLTAGVNVERSDKHGTTTSPRLALVYNPRRNINMKMLYGRGVRRPTLLESSLVDAPGIVRNPDVQPEQLESVDLGFTWHTDNNRQFSSNVYYHQTIDQINHTNAGVLGVYPVNTGTQYGHGAEIEFSQKLPKGSISLFGAYQRNQVNGVLVGYAPRSEFGILYTRKITEHVDIGLRVKLVSASDRPPDDEKTETHSYTRSDVNIRWAVGRDLQVSMLLKNIANDQTAEPNFIASAPLDRDLPPREATITIAYSF